MNLNFSTGENKNSSVNAFLPFANETSSGLLSNKEQNLSGSKNFLNGITSTTLITETVVASDILLPSLNPNSVVLTDSDSLFYGGKIDLSTQVIGVLPEINGGTGSGSGSGSEFLLKSGGTMTGDLILYGNPTNPLSAATKQYVDNKSSTSNAIKQSCYAATLTNLNATYNNNTSGIGATLINAGALIQFQIDGTTPPINSRILIKNQTNPVQNGIYTLTVIGSISTQWILTRATDFDESEKIQTGTIMVINNGSQQETCWINLGDIVTIGVDSITFSQLGNSSSGTVTSISASTNNSTALSISGYPITTNGTLQFTIGNELIGLAGLSSNGIITRKSSGTYSPITITGTTNSISVTNGDGISGNPTLAISSGYVGQTSITTLGTINTGTWNASTISVSRGGTNSTIALTGNKFMVSNSSGTSIIEGISITNPSFITITSSGLASAGSLSVTNSVNFSTLASSLPVLTDSSKNLVSGSISLTSMVSGILPVSFGGTNSNISLTGNKFMISNAGGTSIIESMSITDPVFTSVTSDILASDSLAVVGDIIFSQLTPSNLIVTDASSKLVSMAISELTIDLSTQSTNILSVSHGGTGSSLPLNNNKLMISSAGTIIEGPSSINPLFMSVTATSSISTSTLNVSSLTASSVVLTDSSKNLVSGTVSLSTMVSGILPVSLGGTGTTTLTGNKFMISNAAGTAIIEGTSITTPSFTSVTTTTLSATTSISTASINVSNLTTSSVVLTDGSKNLVSGTISLSTMVSGLLPITFGGTNSSTSLSNNKIMVSSNGSIVEGPSSSSPTFTNVIATSTITSDIVTTNSLTTTDINVTSLSASSVVLTDGDSKLITGQIILTSQVTSILPINNGGTNANTSAQALSNLGGLPITGGNMTGYLILNADPVDPLGAVTKQYVDTVSAGLYIKQSSYAASTTNLDATYNNGASGVGATLTNSSDLAQFQVDGTTPPINSRILIKNQTSSFQNGIYNLTTIGSGVEAWVLTRTPDFDMINEIQAGALVYIDNGNLQSSTGWIQTFTLTDVGVDPVLFSQYSTSTTGTVTSISASTNNSTALSISGYPITTNGTLAFTVGTELIGLAALNSNGIITRTSSGAYSPITITGSSNSITVTNGSGVSGNPTISIASTYIGQSSITTLGTITTGTWNASTISISKGGTNSTTPLTNNKLMISLGDAIVEGTSSISPEFTNVTATSTIASDIVGTNSLTVLTTATIDYLTANSAVITDGSKNLVSGTISLTTMVSEILPINFGGTNSTTALTGNKLMISSSGAIIEGTSSSDPSFTSITASSNITTSSGSLIVTAGNITLPNTNLAETQGVLSFGGSRFLSYLNGSLNTFVGLNAGNTNTSSTGNTAIGSSALNVITTGSNNIVIGNNSGLPYTSSESSNILIGARGIVSESNVTRIGFINGTSSTQTSCYIDGINGITPSATSLITVISNTGQFGTISSGTSGFILTSNGAGSNPSFQANTAIKTISTDSGSASQSSNIVNILGGSNISTSATSSTVTINLNANPTVTTLTASGNITTSAGNVTLTSGNLLLPNTTSTSGTIKMAGATIISNYSSNAVKNLFIGIDSGNLTNSGSSNYTLGASNLSLITSGSHNIAIGLESLQSITTASGNIGIGYSSLSSIETTGENIAIGYNSAPVLSSGNSNVIIGAYAGYQLISGANNILLGANAGLNFTSSESANIIIGYGGAIGDSSVIRIGNMSTKCFIEGINSVTPTNFVKMVGIDSNGQLGTINSETTGYILTSNGSNANPSFQEDLSIKAISVNSVLAAPDTNIITLSTGSSNISANAIDSTITIDLASDLEIDIIRVSDTFYSNGVFKMKLTNTTATEGVFKFTNDNIFMHFGNLVAGTGEEVVGSVYLGELAGNTSNVGVGNVGIGHSALSAMMIGQNNTVVGGVSAAYLSEGSDNTIIGYSAGLSLYNGSGNIIIGSGAGSFYTSSETGNILIGHSGRTNDASITRLGELSVKCFIAGISNVTPSNFIKIVGIDNNGQLGTINSNTSDYILTSNGDSASPSFKINPSLLYLTTGSGFATVSSNSIAINGNSNIVTTATNSTVTVSLNPNLSITSLTLSGSLILPNTVELFSESTRFLLYNSSNIFIGSSSGNITNSGSNNIGLGSESLSLLTTGSDNIAIGIDSLSTLLSGSFNICLGNLSGINYINDEAYNILIGSNGVAGDNFTIRIGDANHQKCFIHGIYDKTPSSNSIIVIVDDSGQFGTIASGNAGDILISNGGSNPSFQAFTDPVFTTIDVSSTATFTGGIGVSSGAIINDGIDITGITFINGETTITGGIFNLGTDSSDYDISLGTNANTGRNITIGNITGSSFLNLRVGTGNFSIDGVGASTYSIGTSTITGSITIGGTAQSGTLTIGNSVNVNTMIIAGGTGATTLQIADSQTAGSISIGNSMTTGIINIGGSSQMSLGTIFRSNIDASRSEMDTGDGFIITKNASVFFAGGIFVDKQIYVGSDIVMTSDNSTNTNSGLRLGNVKGANSVAGLQHASLSVAAGNYAVAQNSSGQTKVNAATGQSVQVCINDTTQLTIDANLATFINRVIQKEYVLELTSVVEETITDSTLIPVPFSAAARSRNWNPTFAAWNFVGPVAGFYRVSYQLCFNYVNDVGVRYGAIYKNAEERYAQVIKKPFVNDFTYTSSSTDIYMNGSTDYISLYAYQTSGGNLTISGSEIPITRLTIIYVCP